jgi:tetratricopeptide (TPR) repeat protein
MVLLLAIAAAAKEGARTGDQKGCREQAAVQQFLRQGADTKQSYEVRRKAYENAAQACSHEGSVYAALTALLLEHLDAAAALTWARRGLQIAPKNPDRVVYEGISLLLIGHPDEALNILEKAPSTTELQLSRVRNYLGRLNKGRVCQDLIERLRQ